MRERDSLQGSAAGRRASRRSTQEQEAFETASCHEGEAILTERRAI